MTYNNSGPLLGLSLEIFYVARGTDSIELAPKGDKGDRVPGNTKFRLHLKSGGGGYPRPRIYLSSPEIEGGKPLLASAWTAGEILETIVDGSMTNGDVQGEFYVAWDTVSPVLVPEDSEVADRILRDFVYRTYLRGLGRSAVRTPKHVPGHHYHTGSRTVVYLGKTVGVSGNTFHAYVYEPEIPGFVKTLSELVEVVDGTRTHSAGISEGPGLAGETRPGSVWVRFTRTASRLFDLGEYLTPDLGPDWTSHLIDQVFKKELRSFRSFGLGYGDYGSTVRTASVVLGDTRYQGKIGEPMRKSIIDSSYWNTIKRRPDVLSGMEGLDKDIGEVMKRVLETAFSSLAHCPKSESGVDLIQVAIDNFLGPVPDMESDVLERIRGLRSNREWKMEILQRSVLDHFGYLGLRRVTATVDLSEVGNFSPGDTPTKIVHRTITDLLAAGQSGWEEKTKGRILTAPDKDPHLILDAVTLSQWYPGIEEELWDHRIYMFAVSLRGLPWAPEGGDQ